MGARPWRLKDITGKKLNKLTALHPTGEKCGNGDALWLFSCDCGKEAVVSIGAFNSSGVKSCGCYRKDAAKRRENYHGLSNSKEHKIWLKVKERCCDVNCKEYKNYGLKGITMSDSWKDSFITFYEDMGKMPAKCYSIDRVDGSLGYFKENCRWSSRYVQSRNRTSSVGTSKYKGVQYEPSSRKWIASISLGKLKAKKIGRYVNEVDAAAAYNLATEMIFGKDSSFTVVNDLDGQVTNVNMKCKFFEYWVFEMINLHSELYEKE